MSRLASSSFAPPADNNGNSTPDYISRAFMEKPTFEPFDYPDWQREDIDYLKTTATLRFGRWASWTRTRAVVSQNGP